MSNKQPNGFGHPRSHATNAARVRALVRRNRCVDALVTVALSIHSPDNDSPPWLQSVRTAAHRAAEPYAADDGCYVITYAKALKVLVARAVAGTTLH